MITYIVRFDYFQCIRSKSVWFTVLHISSLTLYALICFGAISTRMFIYWKQRFVMMPALIYRHWWHWRLSLSQIPRPPVILPHSGFSVISSSQRQLMSSRQNKKIKHAFKKEKTLSLQGQNSRIRSYSTVNQTAICLSIRFIGSVHCLKCNLINIQPWLTRARLRCVIDVKNVCEHSNKIPTSYLSMYGYDILCGISKIPFEIPHIISYPYIERSVFYSESPHWG